MSVIKEKDGEFGIGDSVDEIFWFGLLDMYLLCMGGCLWF
jgi:hypothetical protein